MKRRLHFITLANPYGEESGSQLRARHIIRALQRVACVKLLLADTSERSAADIAAARAACPDVRILHIDEPPDRHGWQYVRRNLTMRSERAYRVVCREADQVRGWIAPGDAVWSFGLKAAAALRLDGRLNRTFLDVDDIPSQVLALERPHVRGRLQRLLISAKIQQWKMREQCLARRYAGIGVCSEADRRYLGGHPAIHVIPNGFTAPVGGPVRRPSAPPRIGFIGNIRYEPNARGVNWFLREVWPRIKAHAPEARFRVVGTGHHKLASPGPDVDILGYVPDPTHEIASWAMLIVPIHIGGGTRVKIADAFSRKCPVVSTPLGAYGHEVVHGRELLLAGSAEEFASQCLRVIHQPDEAAERAEAAYARFLREMTWEVSMRRVEAAAAALLDPSPAGRRTLAAA